MVDDATAPHVTFRARARRWTPPGPCVLCGAEGKQINHKDRDWKNNDPSNLERLCVKCHSLQHSIELWVMIDVLEEKGIPYMKIFNEARRRISANEHETRRRT
jgi:hypothetical protein